jgi:hypothetical protein
MKTLLLSIVLVGLTFCASAQNSTNQLPARLKIKVTCFEGKIDSGVSSGGVCFAPGAGETIDTGSTPGQEHELKYSFVRQNGDKATPHHFQTDTIIYLLCS